MDTTKAFTTARLTVRHFKPEDWHDLLEISLSLAASPFAFADYPWPTDEGWAKESAEYMATDSDMWAIEVTESGKVVCFVNFNGMNEEGVMDIGHVMNMTYGNSGYEEEGLDVLYRYAFDELGASAISAGWAKDDTDKLKPLYALGMTIVSEYEGKALDGSEKTYTGCLLKITKEEFKAPLV